MVTVNAKEVMMELRAIKFPVQKFIGQYSVTDNGMFSDSSYQSSITEGEKLYEVKLKIYNDLSDTIIIANAKSEKLYNQSHALSNGLILSLEGELSSSHDTLFLNYKIAAPNQILDSCQSVWVKQ